MAKILYSVNGEGMGHATRSMALIQELRKKHDVLVIAGSSRVYPYLKKMHNQVKKYEGIRLSYKDDKIDDYETLKKYFTWIAKKSPSSIKQIYKIMKSYNPDILLTDFEGTTSYVANILDIPIVCICNVHSITKLNYRIPKKYLQASVKAKIVIKTIFPKVDYHLITSFFYLPEKSSNVFLFPPILRKEVYNMIPEKKDFILVYQTADTNKKLISELKKINHKFVVYGFDTDKTDSNVIFRKFNNTQWLKDLSECKAVISNGGFSLLSEAVSLHKSVLSMPIKGQFEQILNALQIKRLGYGEMHESVDAKKIIKFTKNLKKYENKLKYFKREDNSKVLAKIEEIIAKECSS
jgi:uncharacterized protein (TIGR00661 family)